MNLYFLSKNQSWDFPFFKRLARNDTAAAPGNQAGIVIPKDLRSFFPGLAESSVSILSPTTDRRIQVQLFVEDCFLSSVSARYQFQTWGGKRSPESRLTHGLSKLRKLANGGDILVFQRHQRNLNLYKLTLIRQSSQHFDAADSLTEGNKWGIYGKSSPLSYKDLKQALAEETDREASTFNLFDNSSQINESTIRRVARTVAFRETLYRLYSYKCAACLTTLKSPTGEIELDAAHIVPRYALGADDARNGLALCKRHHWAFDRGLLGISNSFEILIPTPVSGIPENSELESLKGKKIARPLHLTLSPHPDALAWHREHVLLKS